MCESDLEQVNFIEQTAQLNPWSLKQFLSSLQSSHQCYVLEKGDAIVAYAVTSTAADEAELLNITVDVKHQRQGLGQLVLTYIVETFTSDIHTLFLEVRASNHAAIQLYECQHFKEVGLRPNYYPAKNGCREDAIIMAKMLHFS